MGGFDGATAIEVWEYAGAQWVRRPAPDGPTASVTPLVYDSAARRLSLHHSSSGTWDLDGTVWRNTNTNAPWPRIGGALSSGAAQTILFGGAVNTIEKADTWGWNGQRWALLTSQTSPPARRNGAMAFDGQRVVLFGGSPASNDTWAFSANQWAQLQPTSRPPPTATPFLAFDEARNRLVLLGVADETWEFDGATWARVGLAGAPPIQALDSFSLLFDSQQRQVVAARRGLSSSELWAWNGATWTPFAPNGPPPRIGNAAYDPIRQRLVWLTGNVTSGLATWEWNGQSWAQQAVLPPPSSTVSLRLVWEPVQQRVMATDVSGSWLYFPP
jgi:hypothetical protein